MITTFETASIGDRVWCVSIGWGTITSTHEEEDYPIIVAFDSAGSESFTKEGRLYTDDIKQTLFWDEIKFEVPTKPIPLPSLDKDDCVEVWNTNSDNPILVSKRHFSHFHLGRIYCFENGGTSWSSTETIGWSRWRKPE